MGGSMRKQYVMLLGFILAGFLSGVLFCSFANATTNDFFNGHSVALAIPDDMVWSSERVCLIGFGDNLIHENISKGADMADGVEGDGKYNFMPLYSELLHEMTKYDLRFINQETISGGDETGITGFPAFNTPMAMIDDLNNMGFNIINMANNHCLDRSALGVQRALARWAETDAMYYGVFDTIEASKKIPIMQVKGLTFSFLSYTSHTNGVVADTPWRVSYMEKEKIKHDIKKASSISDFVIVSAHWGWDDQFLVDDFQKEYAQIFCEAGADVVIGTGPHVIQPMKWYEHKGHKTLIIFSLGNFISSMHGAFNELEGMITVDFVIDHGIKKMEHVTFHPLVMHLETDLEKIKVYKLEDYTPELCQRHRLSKMGKEISIPYFYKILYEQIDADFITIGEL